MYHKHHIVHPHIVKCAEKCRSTETSEHKCQFHRKIDLKHGIHCTKMVQQISVKYERALSVMPYLCIQIIHQAF